MSTETITYNDDLITANTEQILANQSLVYEAGQKAEYDNFWDNFQNYGKRTIYQNGFAGPGWNDTTFKPKYDIVPIGNISSIFQQSNIKDLEAILNNCGVTLNTSQATTLSQMFYFSTSLTSVPEIDTRGTTATDALALTFNNCSNLKTIKNLILKDDGSQLFSNTFGVCPELKNLTIAGVIGQKGFGVGSCKKLSGDSIVSIIEALSDTTSGLTVTLSQTAVDNMVFPITGNKGTYNSWTELEQTKTNWTISLV